MQLCGGVGSFRSRDRGGARGWRAGRGALDTRARRGRGDSVAFGRCRVRAVCHSPIASVKRFDRKSVTLSQSTYFKCSFSIKIYFSSDKERVHVYLLTDLLGFRNLFTFGSHVYYRSLG